MLEKVSYLGYELVNSSFSLLNVPKGKGHYKYSVNQDGDFRFSEVTNDGEHVHNEITISVNSHVHGFVEGSDDPVFTLDAKFLVTFELDKADFIEEEFAIENKWFFMNFAAIASKSIIDSTLSHTALKGTFIPSSTS